jgi:hypothetical protein
MTTATKNFNAVISVACSKMDQGDRSKMTKNQVNFLYADCIFLIRLMAPLEDQAGAILAFDTKYGVNHSK